MSTTLLEMRRTQRRASRGRIAARGGEAIDARGPAGGGHDDLRAGHVPVLADELLGLLDVRPGQTAIDCTFGDGGHARLVAERLGARGPLVAIDRDPPP